jgi:Spx/MgsR family transcriptional regulator
MMLGMTKPSITVYGIPNCDSVKKARAWFAGQGLDYVFYDFKKAGVPAEKLPLWLASAGRDVLINRQGTTWRKLDSAVQASVQDDASATDLMLAQASVIKRPVVEWTSKGTTHTSVGYCPDVWQKWMAD